MAKTKTSPYVARFTDDAVDDIKALPRNVRNTLRKAITDVVLRDPVRCSEELAEPLEGFRSFHHGAYRLVYRVAEDSKSVAFVGVGKKAASRNVYARLERLAAIGKIAQSVLSTLRVFDPPKR